MARCALVRVDPTEEQEIAAVAVAEGERVQVDAVVDRRVVGQRGMTVRVADGHVVADVVVGGMHGTIRSEENP